MKHLVYYNYFHTEMFDLVKKQFPQLHMLLLVLRHPVMGFTFKNSVFPDCDKYSKTP